MASAVSETAGLGVPGNVTRLLGATATPRGNQTEYHGCSATPVGLMAPVISAIGVAEPLAPAA